MCPLPRLRKDVGTDRDDLLPESSRDVRGQDRYMNGQEWRNELKQSIQACCVILTSECL